MIYVIHNHTKVVKVVNKTKESFEFDAHLSIPETMLALAQAYPDETIVWCHKDLEENINTAEIPSILHHKQMMVSYNPFQTNFFGERIGYVDASLFVNINKEVTFPTWQMSGLIGATSSSVLLQVKSSFYKNTQLDYFLSSVAKSYMPLSLFCYSVPKLLIPLDYKKEKQVKATKRQLFKFVKEHYKFQWVFFLLLNTWLYEKKVMFLSALPAFFSGKQQRGLEPMSIPVESSRKVIKEGTIDVIIPTIGRKDYLFDVLQDLKQQTVIPSKVIIVEQNPDPASNSELDYLNTETWPFQIDHTFTHTTGACNARNLALSKVTSEWVFMNDDDNRFAPDLIERAFAKIKQYGTKVATTCYMQPGEAKVFNYNFQTSFFGSGNSFVKAELLSKVKYNMALEFGYGEDTEYGHQLRSIGEDVIYFEDLNIDHLKAPRGGFRTKFVHPWENDLILPKPSPTVMYVAQRFNTKQQLNSYKTTLAIKFYKDQPIKNIVKYIRNFNKRWEASKLWANQLEKKSV